MNQDDPNQTPDLDHDVEEIDRREALKRLGKYGAYTAPVVVALLSPSRAKAGAPPISWTM